MRNTEEENHYQRNHKRTVKARGRAAAHKCIRCGKQAEDWAQVHGTSGEEPEDYQPMCTACHIRYDRGIPDGCCGNGHARTEENTWMRPMPNGRAKAVCKDCNRDAQRRHYEAHREDVLSRNADRRREAYQPKSDRKRPGRLPKRN